MTKNLSPPTVQIEAYSGQSVHSLGSCVLHLHIGNKAFPTVFEVTNMTEPIILSRTQAKAMGYVEFPKIKCPHTFTTCSTTLKRFAQTKHTCQRLQITLHLQIQLTKYMYTK